MTHLLNTNSCVDHLRRGSASTVTTKLAAAPPGSVVICSVVVAELHYGAHRSVRKTEPTLLDSRGFRSRTKREANGSREGGTRCAVGASPTTDSAPFATANSISHRPATLQARRRCLLAAKAQIRR